MTIIRVRVFTQFSTEKDTDVVGVDAMFDAPDGSILQLTARSYVDGEPNAGAFFYCLGRLAGQWDRHGRPPPSKQRFYEDKDFNFEFFDVRIDERGHLVLVEKIKDAGR